MRICESLALIGSMQFGLSGPLDCHVYALQGPSGVVLIDAGGGTHTERLLANLRADLGRPEVDTLIITHCHLDHCGGATSLQAATNCRVVAPEQSRAVLASGDEELSGLRAARGQGVYPSDFRFSACPVDVGLHDGEGFEVAGLRFVPIHIRGHSRDSFCLLTKIQGSNWLFSGDSVFYGGVLGIINAEGSEMAGYRSDLPKLGGLAIEGLFPGHGLFTLHGGQRHLDCAIEQAKKNFLAHQIGQGDLIF